MELPRPKAMLLVLFLGVIVIQHAAGEQIKVLNIFEHCLVTVVVLVIYHSIYDEYTTLCTTHWPRNIVHTVKTRHIQSGLCCAHFLTA